MSEHVIASEELWRLTLQHSPVGMALVALDGTFLSANDALCRMLGYDEPTLCSLQFQDITHPDDLEVDLHLLHETIAGERSSYRMQKRYVRADGELVWGDLSVALLRGDDGEPIHFISQILDVTATRSAQVQLAEKTALLDQEHRMAEAILDTVDVGMVLIDADGAYQRMNKRHHHLMRLAFPDGHRGRAGQLGLVFTPDGTTPLTPEQMPSMRAANGEEFDDLRLWVGDDPATRVALSVSARLVRDAEGRWAGAVLAYKDVTELIRAIQVKDEFVASVSHELRTPLTAVLGHLELLADREDLPADAADHLRTVERNARRLQYLVGDLLHVASGRGGVRLKRREIDIAASVAEAVTAAAPVAEASGVSLAADLPESLVAVVDGLRMRQIADNLISNAVKYTDAGGSVRVSLRLVGDQVQFVVADTGIGIGAAEIEHLFTRFFRGGEALARQIPGTGLGLAIVRSIVEAHGGTISLDSTAGEGSTFTVVLPHVAA